MTNAVVLDLVVLLALGIGLIRGWHHRSIREFFSLMGLAVGMLAAPFLTGPLASLIDLSPLDVNVSRAVAAGLTLGIPALVGAIFGVRTSRAVTPRGPVRLDALGGSMFALVRGILIASMGLYALTQVSPRATGSEKSIGSAVADSVSGQLLTGPHSAFTIVYDAALRRSTDLQALALWLRQRSGYDERVPDDGGVAFAATNERLDPAPSAEDRMLDLLNRERTDRGLEPLAWCGSCAEVAREHSKDMYRNGYFSHVDSRGEDPFDRMVAADIVYAAAGENLSIAPTVAKAHDGLMGSPDHRENILRELFDEVGIGCYEGPYGFMCTQVFRALV